MLRTTLATIVLSLVMIAAPCQAGTLTVNGIQKFNTSLGVLTSATVTLDPPPTLTLEEDVPLGVSTHTHLAAPSPIALAGLGSFLFPPTSTAPASNGLGGDHNHGLNLVPSVKVFSGTSLGWFLSPGAPIMSVTLPTFFTNQGGTQSGDQHSHRVPQLSILPTTTFEFTTIPEPGSAGLLGLLCLAGGFRRIR